MVLEAIKVAKAPLVACLTCPLCGRLLEEATTISECLHTFCRDCIEQRLSDDVNCCPICDVYLGCTPLDKLRADPQLDEVRNKLFSSVSVKRKSVSFQPRRKERSLSSLGLSSIPSSSKRGRRSRVRNLTISSSSSEDKDGTLEQPRPDIKRFTRSLLPKHSREPSPSLSEDGRDEKAKLVDQTPLEYLAELADADAENLDVHQQAAQVDEKKPPTTRRYGKLSRPTRGVVRRQPPPPEEPPFISVDGGGTSRSSFVWFALKPAEDQPEGSALPIITTPYLRVNDGRIPVSVVKKYIAAKLELQNDGEVEITCCSQPIVPSLPLESVRNTWLSKPRHDNSNPAICENSSSSSQQLVMTLNYRRKAPALS